MAQDSLALVDDSLWSMIQSIPALVVSSIIQTIKGPSFSNWLYVQFLYIQFRAEAVLSTSFDACLLLFFNNHILTVTVRKNIIQMQIWNSITEFYRVSITCLKCCKVFFNGPLNVWDKYDTMTCIYTIPKDKGFTYNHHLYGNVVLHFQPYIIRRKLCVAFHCKAAEVGVE